MEMRLGHFVFSLGVLLGVGDIVFARNPFELRWTYNVSSPFTPMSLGIIAAHNKVVVGSRDCPDNSRNLLEFLDLDSGTPGHTVNDTSNVAVAHRHPKRVIAAGVGWDEPKSRTHLARVSDSGVGDWGDTFKGDPAMWVPTAVSGDGVMTALLLEPEPDLPHLNNRSGRLMVFGANPSHQQWPWVLEIDGMGSMDPQSVAISSTGFNETMYTVGALIGTTTVLADVDANTGEGKVIYRSPGDGLPEIAMAVGPAGRFFAVSDNAAVNIFARQPTAFGASNSFVLIATAGPPQKDKYPGQSPIRVAFGGGQGHTPLLLAVAWGSGDGSTVAVSTHIIHSGSTPKVTVSWESVRVCNGGADILSPNCLAVSAGGEWVVLGSWGCGTPHPNLAVWRGVGGGSQPVLQHFLPGQIWAVDVDVDSANQTVYVGAGSWATESDPSQVVVFGST